MPSRPIESTSTREHRRAAPRSPDERRAEIIAAALPLLIQQGESVTTRELARAAGVSEGTLFNVFSGKDELITAVVESALDQEPFERAVRAIDPTLGPFDAVVAAVRLVQERTVEIWQLLSALGTHQASGDRPLPVSSALTELFERYDLTLGAPEASRLLRALTLALTHPRLTPEAMAPERIASVFLHGVGAGATTGERPR